MSTAEAERGLSRSSIVVIGAVCVASTGILVATQGNLGLAIAPVLGVAVTYLIWHIPLRYSTVTLFFLQLTTERRGDSHDKFHSPFYPIGIVLNTKLSSLSNIKLLQISGADAIVFYLLLILIVRASVDSRVDGPDRLRVQTARPLGACAVVIMLAIGAAFARGLTNRGEISQAIEQGRPVLHIALFFLVFQAGLRGPADFRAVGYALVLAACVRAVLVIYVRTQVLYYMTADEMNSATNHDDSMTFALAICVLLISLSEKTTWRSVLAFLIPLPLIISGVVLNNRRLFWVDLAMVVFAYGMMSPRTPLKRLVLRAIVVAIPLFILYVAVGWNSGSKIFGPVKMVKSVVASDTDRSTMDRDVENWNLIVSMRGNLLAGRGLGGAYDEIVQMDDISGGFAEYRSIPHNSILGICLFFGCFGLVAIFSAFVMTVFLGYRAYLKADTVDVRVASFGAVSMVVIFLNQAYGDMAFWTDVGIVLLSMAMAVAGKAAVATGAWPGWRGAPSTNQAHA